MPPIPGRPPSQDAGLFQGKSPPSVALEGNCEGFLLEVDSHPQTNSEHTAIKKRNSVFFIKTNLKPVQPEPQPLRPERPERPEQPVLPERRNLPERQEQLREP